MATERTTLSRLLDDIMVRHHYKSLSELARHTSIPYQTLYTWYRSTRAQKVPPTQRTLRRLAVDFDLPLSAVYTAAGRTFTSPSMVDLGVDAQTAEVIEVMRVLELPARERFARIAALYASMTPGSQEIAESVLRGIPMEQ